MPVAQQGKGGRLHSANIKRLSVQQRKQPCRIDTDKPIRPQAAQRRLIKIIVCTAVFEIRKPLTDRTFFH